jgi:hypothetical protein
MVLQRRLSLGTLTPILTKIPSITTTSLLEDSCYSGQSTRLFTNRMYAQTSNCWLRRLIELEQSEIG